MNIQFNWKRSQFITEAQTSSFDNVLLSVLQQIKKRECNFEPKSQEVHHLLEFQPIAKALISAKNKGFLEGLEAHDNYVTGDRLYDDVAVLGGLSHEGEVYIEQELEKIRLRRILTRVQYSVFASGLILSILGVGFENLIHPGGVFWIDLIRLLSCSLGGGLFATNLRLLRDQYFLANVGQTRYLILFAVMISIFVDLAFVVIYPSASDNGLLVLFSSLAITSAAMGIKMQPPKMLGGLG